MTDRPGTPSRHAHLVETAPDTRGLCELTVRVGAETLVDVGRVAFLSPGGSHLYGTHDALSDLDLKGVFVAPLDEIVLGRDRSSIRASTAREGARNRPGDVDVELFELRSFVRDALAGRPDALELLHAPSESALVTSPLWQRLLGERDRLISQRLDPFVGYCRARARRYGERPDRLAVVEQVVAALQAADPESRLRSVVDDLPLDDRHLELVEQPLRGQTDPAILLDVAGKRFELDSPVTKALGSLRGLLDESAVRARRSEQEVDWKAVSHAYRMGFELEELLATGRLEFPLERADFLRRVKRGEITWRRATREIPELVERALATPSDLPEASDEAFWEQWLLATYLESLD